MTLKTFEMTSKFHHCELRSFNISLSPVTDLRKSERSKVVSQCFSVGTKV